MFKEQRIDKILDIIRENKYVTVDVLVSRLHYSPATIRRDITYLANLGIVKKSYGGVSITAGKPSIIREHENIPNKVKVCKRALDLINDGDRIFIDGTTTTYFLGEFLIKKKNVTVFTTNLKLAIYLGEHKINCYVCGGKVHDSTMLGGPYVSDLIEKTRFDKAFFSVGTINKEGQISVAPHFWDFMKSAFRNSKSNILLCDREKLNEYSKSYYADVNAFDTVICDCEMPDVFYEKFKNTTFITAE